MARVLIVLAFVAVGVAFISIPSVQQFGRRLLTSSERITIPGRAGDGPPLELVTLLGFDAIPAILSPKFVSAGEAEQWMDTNEQVLGVSVNGDSRAYSINMLSRHEIVNDVVGGVPIAVTW